MLRYRKSGISMHTEENRRAECVLRRCALPGLRGLRIPADRSRKCRLSVVDGSKVSHFAMGFR